MAPACKNRLLSIYRVSDQNMLKVHELTETKTSIAKFVANIPPGILCYSVTPIIQTDDYILHLVVLSSAKFCL